MDEDEKLREFWLLPKMQYLMAFKKHPEWRHHRLMAAVFASTAIAIAVFAVITGMLVAWVLVSITAIAFAFSVWQACCWYAYAKAVDKVRERLRRELDPQSLDDLIDLIRECEE